MYEIGFSLQPVQRELKNLVDLDIVKKAETRNRVYYEINENSHFYNPLKKSTGLRLNKNSKLNFLEKFRSIPFQFHFTS